ncbi:MAG TPA: aminotransferase class I/II-fold pyridoxal phosphate-dependent enzyme [Nitrososphaera sp.]|nr:aminotransferase class I/II-fold pyridoxal phosphate-dependent enzyme [Nitrososphaera sp.]
MASPGDKELESLRGQIRAVTFDIVKKVHERMALAEQVGEIKGRLGIDVKDEKVEQEIRLMVIRQAEDAGMSREFALRLLNILLAESEAIQTKNRIQKRAPRQTHLSIFQKAKQMEASGRHIIHLEVGEPDYPAPAQVGRALSESFRQRKYHYTDPRGIPPLRAAIAKKNEVSEDSVIVTPGGRFAVFAAIASLVRPGEEIITIEPAWPAYRECADFTGARTKALKTTLESGWTPDLKELESLITSGTKMIALNYPNNPTGKVLDKKTMDGIVSLAKDWKLYLLSDEVYSDYSFSKPFTSVQSYGYEKCVIVSSFSKTYAMTGFRVGYSLADPDLVKKMAKVQAVGVTSVAEPMQLAALAALDVDPSENIDLMKKRLRFLSSKLKEMSLQFMEPDGAMYVYPQLPNNGDSEERDDDMQIVERLLEKGVAIAPGTGFGESYRRFVRISACRDEEDIAKGLAIMTDELEKAQ